MIVVYGREAPRLLRRRRPAGVQPTATGRNLLVGGLNPRTLGLWVVSAVVGAVTFSVNGLPHTGPLAPLQSAASTADCSRRVWSPTARLPGHPPFLRPDKPGNLWPERLPEHSSSAQEAPAAALEPS